MFYFSSKENEWNVATFFDVIGYLRKKLQVKSQFSMFCSNSVKNNEFPAYNQNERHLDDFYFNILNNDWNEKEFWEFPKLTLILSHGNVSVESSFLVCCEHF